jgi:NADPH:quinone reductase-like Zn-dependent oxidoreductase
VTREVWRISRAGSLDRLRMEREELPPPGPGQARVAVRAVGLNLADVFACLGLYSATPRGPFVPGLEFAGVVEEAGPDLLSPCDPGPVFHPGDRVIGLTRFGAYATAINADRRYLRPMAESWSFAEAASFPVQAITAWYALHNLARVQPGDVVLVHSAAGGVGLNALALLRGCQAFPIATVGREEKRRFLIEHLSLAPAQIIVRDRRRFGSELDAALASAGTDGFDVVLDAVAGPWFQPAFDRLRPEGRMVIFGAADMMPAGSRPNYLALAPRYFRRPRIDPLAMMSRNRSVIGFNLIWLWDRVDRLAAIYEQVSRALTSPPMVGRTYPFARAPEALSWFKRGESIGKVVLEVITSS